MSVKARKLTNGTSRYRASIMAAGTVHLGEHGWTDKRTAEADERRLLDRRDSDLLAASAGLTLGAWLDRYLQEKLALGIAGTTAAKYRDQIRRIDEQLGDRKLSSIRPDDVVALRDELRIGRGLHTTTVRDTLALLGRALKLATNRGLIARNPAAADVVERPRGRRLREPARDLGERAPEILEAVRGHDHLDAAVHLALGVGLRREETIGLRWPNVDLERVDRNGNPDPTITIAEVLTTSGRRDHAKTDAGMRTIHLPATVAAALRRHRDAQRQRLAARDRITDVVIDCDGGSWRPDNFSRSWRRFTAGTALAGISFKDLRNGGAQNLRDSGMPIELALAIGGWAERELLDLYAPGRNAADLRTAANLLDAMLVGR